jgi:hypothetical protein
MFYYDIISIFSFGECAVELYIHCSILLSVLCLQQARHINLHLGRIYIFKETYNHWLYARWGSVMLY